MTQRLSWLPIAAVMAGTTFVAVTAFVLAFDGSRGAAADAGIAQAGWYPWCIEGVIVCASLCTLVLDRRWPWFILLAFTAVSVAANVLHAWEQPGWMWWSLAFAAVPPLALPICVHLVLMVVGRPRGLVAAGAVGTSSREEVTDAGGSGDHVPVRNPDPPASTLPALAHANGNGHAKTNIAKAVEHVPVFEAEHKRRPTQRELAAFAKVHQSTARDALALTRKG